MSKKSKIEEVNPLEVKQDHVIEKEFIELIDDRFTN